MKKLLKNKTVLANARIYLLVTLGFVVMFFMNNAGMLSSSWKGYLVPICVYISLAVSLNLLVCICGELSLGHAGFMGIGAFTGAVFGGIGSIPGAMLGGILLGIIETFSKSYISTQFSDAIVFAVLIIVLLVKPTGLLGKQIREKV